MTPADFRRLALAYPTVVEGAHHGHADFRVGGRVIASLGYPSDAFAVVMLTPLDQDLLVRDYPSVFAPATGKWGVSGNTTVTLAAAHPEPIGAALEAAWRRRAPKRLVSAFDSESRTAG
jgi:hypothetical protein